MPGHEENSPSTPRPPGIAEDPAVDQFFLDAYRDLRRIAHSRLHRNAQLTLLDTTALVHECYLRFAHVGEGDLKDRTEYLAYASSVMRSVVVDFVRRRHTQRRGGDEIIQTLDTAVAESVADASQEVLDINAALDELAKVEPRLAQVVEMRYFGGCTEPEIAQALNLTERTVRRDWDKARKLLRLALRS